MQPRWHPPRQVPDPELVPFEIPDDGLAYNYSGTILDGRYQLDRPIGPGGTSTVYSGKDLRTGARIAVKILNADMHEHLLGLFGQEGRVAARHTCPHLVQAIDFGKHDDCAFTVFKFVEGISLFNLGRDNPLPWRRVVRIAIQILTALDDLHTRGLVHGDLHPSNVLIRRDVQGLDFATVIDVGFATVIPPQRITGAPEPTRYIFGMGRYIAPERRAGDAPSPPSDLYALGVLLWELLTAQILPAYEIDPGLAIPPLHTIAPGLDIPEALDEIVMRALSDVEHRYRDAQEMALALRDVLEWSDRQPLTAPLATPSTTPLALAAAVAVATLPTPTRAAHPAAPTGSPDLQAQPSAPPTALDPCASLVTPSHPASSSLPDPTHLTAASPPALVTPKVLGALLSVAFVGGSVAGGVAVRVATAGEAAAPPQLILAVDDDSPGASTPPRPVHHEPFATPPPAPTPTPRPAPTEAPLPAPTEVSKPHRTIPASPQVARARKGLLACNPPAAQLRATVVIGRDPNGEPRVRLDDRDPLGAFGDCARKVAQSLHPPADRRLRFKL